MSGVERMMLACVVVLTCLLGASAALAGDVTGPAQLRQLEERDFGAWERIGGYALAPDGDWFFYRTRTVDGDVRTRLVATDGSTPEVDLGPAPQARFSPSGRFLVYSRARESSEEDQKVTVRNLETREVKDWPSLASFRLAKDADILVGTIPEGRRGPDRPRAMEVRHLGTERARRFEGVVKSALSPDGSRVAAVVRECDNSQRLVLVELQSLESRTVATATKFESRPRWSDDGDALIIIERRDAADEKNQQGLLAVRGASSSTPKSHYLTPSQVRELCPDSNCRPVDRMEGFGPPRWLEGGNRLLVGLQAEEPVDESAGESVDVTLWHWRDHRLAPRRESGNGADALGRTVAVWDLGEGTVSPILELRGEQSLELLDGRLGLLTDPTPHQPHLRERWRDFRTLDLETGELETVISRQESVEVSPSGRHILYFRDGDWWIVDPVDGDTTNLTKTVDTRFDDYTQVSGREQHEPFGSGQWGQDDRWVLLYSRYDVYRAAADGSSIQRLTRGGGSRGMRYRDHRIDWHAEAPGPEDALYFSMFGERDKSHGYARLGAEGELRTLTEQPRRLRFLHRADREPVYIFLSESATESPNFHATRDDFETIRQVSDTNPQQHEYQWAGDTLLDYEDQLGQTRQARLLYPADYRPGRRYPMVVLIYENRSDNLHSYNAPNMAGLFNQRVLSAAGFFVLEPDIAYTLNNPGRSALGSVVPAVEAAVDTGKIDPDAVALAGHSWGGYQTAFIVSQTDLFAAAVAAAPVTNLLSQYASIYRRTGRANTGIFEVGQGRLAAPFWALPDAYTDNSPVFHAHRISTPLMMVFGTNDQAVDFNQGVELYNAMRRADSPVVMLAYEGEGHRFRSQSNRKDATRRKLAWFRHHLLGEAPAPWMVGADGVAQGVTSSETMAGFGKAEE